MTTATSALQTLVNAQAIRAAEAQFRIAVLFTPYGFQPEKVDFDRVEAFLDDPYRAFPQPTESIRTSLDRTVGNLVEARAILAAVAALGVEPTLDADQLFTTAKANVTNPSMARAA